MTQTLTTLVPSGGNIAENAGGKKAVLWGTTVDSVYWYRMVGPNGEWIEVTRLNHNLGKIHKQKEVEFEVVYKEGTKDPENAKVLCTEHIKIDGSTIRKPGLGKKTLPTSSSVVFQDFRKKAPTALLRLRNLFCTRCPRSPKLCV